jgi:hypothetical protein
MKSLLIKWSLAFATFLGWTPPACTKPHFESPFLADAVLGVEQVSSRNESGDFLRREVLLFLINRHPEAKERDLNLAIEMAVQQKKSISL